MYLYFVSFLSSPPSHCTSPCANGAANPRAFGLFMAKQKGLSNLSRQLVVYYPRPCDAYLAFVAESLHTPSPKKGALPNSTRLPPRLLVKPRLRRRPFTRLTRHTGVTFLAHLDYLTCTTWPKGKGRV